LFCVVSWFLIIDSTLAQTVDIPKLKAETQHRIDTYLDKNHTLGDFYTISDSGMVLFATPEKKGKNEYEYFIRWDKLSFFQAAATDTRSKIPFQQRMYLMEHVQSDSTTLPKPHPSNKTKPIDGIRIALDPGHTAGTLENGKLEQKYLEIKQDSVNGIPKDVELVEGQLTMRTALILKKKLEEAGAEVMLTRKPDETAFGISYAEWKKKYLHQALDSLVKCKSITPQKKTFILTKAKDKQIFMEVFRDIELRKRADLINDFLPDITVIIHYNVDEKNVDWKKLSDKNYVMTFIGGAMTPAELNKSEKRFEFLRLALCNDLDKSEKLSSCVVQRFSQTLNVPVAAKNDATYLHDNCLTTSSSGVYCRNLILCRIVHSTLVYGETLYQDNREECYRLMQVSDSDPGRVQEVAQAYYAGILDYFTKK
ncbi:MAG TPA: N-acetylmuramoyl-L-alanine amidase, partial [Bacteroidia bacterium]|nr:N-acetylmuramoyl-L-alanine amidase [Bacteroidia bacterium]